MNEKIREEVALFRFGVISDLVCSRLDPGEMSARIREKSQLLINKNSAIISISYQRPKVDLTPFFKI